MFSKVRRLYRDYIGQKYHLLVLLGKMGFLYPSFLWAMVLIAIPVAIHLFNFRAYRKVYFSNTVMLENIADESRSGRRLKDRLLLALRSAAILSLVLAFSRPYFSNSGPGLLKAQNKLNIIYLDNSFSMSLHSPVGTLLDLAKNKCTEQVRLNAPDTRYLLMTADFKAVEDKPIYRKELLARLNKISITSFHRDLYQIISRARTLSQGWGNQNDEIYSFYSDFQTNVFKTGLVNELKGLKILFYPCRPASANTIKDISIDTIRFASPVFRPGLKNEAILHLSRTYNSPLNTEIRMKLNGQIASLNTVKWGKLLNRDDTLDFTPQANGIQNLEFSIPQDNLAFNNALFATVNVRQYAHILLISGSKTSKYLDAVYAGDPFFSITKTTADHIDYGQLHSQNLIILDRLQQFSSGFAVEMLKYYKQGGAVMFIPSMENSKNQFVEQRKFLETLKVDYPMGIKAAKSRVLHLNMEMDLFRGVFESMPNNARLPEASHYLKFSHLYPGSASAVLKLVSGDNLLTRQKRGKGTWFNVAAPFEDSCQTTQRQDLFVPLMYQIALSGVQSGSYYYQIHIDKNIEHSDSKSVQDTETSEKPLQARQISNRDIRLLGNGVEIIPELRTHEGSEQYFIAGQPELPGFFTLMQGKSVLQGYAFNYDRDESNLSYFSDKEIAHLTGFTPLSDLNLETSAPLSGLPSAVSGSWLWKVCLILALIFLALEEFLLHMKRFEQ